MLPIELTRELCVDLWSSQRAKNDNPPTEISYVSAKGSAKSRCVKLRKKLMEIRLNKEIIFQAARQLGKASYEKCNMTAYFSSVTSRIADIHTE